MACGPHCPILHHARRLKIRRASRHGARCKAAMTRATLQNAVLIPMGVPIALPAS